MQWSRLRTLVESRFADAVKGRVQLQTTGYRGMHDHEGREWITIDGQEIVNMPHWYGWTLRDYIGQPNQPAEIADYASLFARGGLRSAMHQYLDMSIDDVVCSENVLVRAIGMLDRRVGKRKLRILDTENEHPLVRLFHGLRCHAEALVCSHPRATVKDVNLRHPPLPWSRSKGEKEEKTRQAVARLGSDRKTRRLPSLITQIHRGAVAHGDRDNPVAREILAGIERASDRDALLESLRFVEAKSKLLKSPVHVRGVIELTRNATDWVRPLEQWVVKSHNPHRQFSSLARHLWAVYDVPLFMDRAWLDGNLVQQQWFRHIGAGGNIRTAEGLPVPLTKKMAHCFLDAPDDYSIEAAFRYGQVLALGGDRRLSDALRETRMVADFRDDEFWLSVIGFFVRNPMLDPVHIGPIVDYISNQRYEPRVVFIDRGVAQEVGPEQPNFSMRGRTVASLLNSVAEWHRRLGREVAGGRLQWRKSGFQDFKFVEGSKKAKNMKIWTIRELLSSQELTTEGQRMHHCVASYANSCHRGKCSIWSMDLETDEGVEPLLTIEVNHACKELRQARGKYNRRPEEKEKDVLRRWALREGLTIASYV